MRWMRSLSGWLQRTFRSEAYALAREKLEQNPAPDRVIVLVCYGRPAGARQVSCLEQRQAGCLVTVERAVGRGDRPARRHSKLLPASAGDDLWRKLARLGWDSLRNRSSGLRDGALYQIAVGSGRVIKSVLVANPGAGAPHLAVVELLEAFFHEE